MALLEVGVPPLLLRAGWMWTWSAILDKASPPGGWSNVTGAWVPILCVPYHTWAVMPKLSNERERNKHLSSLNHCQLGTDVPSAVPIF